MYCWENGDGNGMQSPSCSAFCAPEVLLVVVGRCCPVRPARRPSAGRQHATVIVVVIVSGVACRRFITADDNDEQADETDAPWQGAPHLPGRRRHPPGRYVDDGDGSSTQIVFETNRKRMPA